MTPARMAEIHALAFQTQRPWSEKEFAELLASSLVFYIAPSDSCFALGRTIAQEAELLTLATAPSHQRRGLGNTCMKAFLKDCHGHEVTDVFLEVDTENKSAIRLYERHGFNESGRRIGYYHHPNGSVSDAIVMSKKLG